MKLEDTGERLIPNKSKDSVVYGEHLSRYAAVTDLVKGKRVLDVACGTGYGSQMLASKAKTVIGVDNSKAAVKYAQTNYSAKNLTYVVDDAEQLENIKDKSIDVVVSMETIEHLKNPEKFIDQIKRVLTTEGVFIVSTPNDDEYREGNDFHLHEFTFIELKKLMKKNFKKTDYYFQGNVLAATLLDKEDYETEFQKSILVHKTISVNTAKAIYFIAVSSNSKNQLPRLKPSVALSQHWNTKGFIEWNEDRERHIKKIEARNKALLEQREEIFNSLSWKLTKPFRGLYRRITEGRWHS